ncbi:hypothetical protein GCM10009789_76050 [Kribbella sancticallisti]|uniref:Secreted protein n=1 Tax=Kribbella sancticallisti TaxID=460087 RepID=A0ABN2EKW8_9ACTN
MAGMLPVVRLVLDGLAGVALAGSRMERIDMVLLPGGPHLPIRGIRTAGSSPGAPHRGGGLPASKPGLRAGTHDLPKTVTNEVVMAPAAISLRGIVRRIVRSGAGKQLPWAISGGWERMLR